MHSALAYKEWLKLRRVFWVPLAVAALALGYTLVSFRHVAEVIGPVMLWLDAVFYEKVFYNHVQLVTAFSGIWFALFQFVPECSGKRLRLLFHLPVPHRKAIYSIVAIGLGATLGVAALTLAGVAAIVATYLPAEAVVSAMVTTAPWLLAGIPAYMGTALVIMEPRPARKLFLSAIFVLFLLPLFDNPVPAAYGPILPGYAVLCLLWLLPLDLLAHRFKRGTTW